MTVVYGTMCLDVTYRLPSLPPKGGYVEMLSEHAALGGEAANTAAAIRRWGGEAVLVGNPIGRGDQADRLAGMLADSGLEDAIYPAGDFSAPVCHIMVTPDGERTMFGRGFAEMETRGDPSLAPMRAGDWFTADPNHGVLARQALRMAHERGMKVYALDFVRDDDEFPRGCFWQSSTSWVGKIGDRDGNARWLESWVARRGCTAVLTDGADGFLFGDPVKGVRHFPAWPVEGVVDSTGAGDVFRAGMLFGLDQDWPLLECLKFASAAAALSTRAVGAIAGITDRAKVEGLITEHPDLAEVYRSRV